MNLVQQFSGLAMEKMPKVISPKGHAIADYAMAAGAFAAAIAFFKTGHKAAGVGALIAGAVETLNPMITDFPGGLFKLISFPTHGRVDVGATSMVASLPKVMNLDGGMESKFFYIHSAAAMAVVAMTNFGGDGQKTTAEAES
jgi:hypothetical protein